MLGGTEWGFNDKVIQTGKQSNHLKATCDGNTLTFEVNGSILMDVNDSDIMFGDVGLYAGTYQEAGAEILFDNFLVHKP